MTTGEAPLTDVESLQPGDIVEIGALAQLPAFEDLVAVSIDQQVAERHPERTTLFDPYAWAGRASIVGLLRPKTPQRFNGTIANVQLTVMDEPYERLRDAGSRGISLGKAGARTTKDANENELADLYRGFVLTADPLSTGRGAISQLQAELWYYPVPFDKSKHQQRTHSYGGRTVHRLVSTPKIETEEFILLNETSRRIGLAVLRSNLSSPINGAMRD